SSSMRQSDPDGMPSGQIAGCEPAHDAADAARAARIRRRAPNVACTQRSRSMRRVSKGHAGRSMARAAPATGTPAPVEQECNLRHPLDPHHERLVARGATALQGTMPENLLSPRQFLDECIAFKQTQPGAGRFFATLARGELPRDLL